MKFQLIGILLSVFASSKSDAVYLDFRTQDGSSFNVTVRGMPVDKLQEKTMKPVKVEGTLKGRVYRGDSGVRQTLEATELNFLPA